MTDQHTKQILSIFNGEVDIRLLSDDAVNLFLELYPYSPYGHLINYLKAEATNNPDSNQLLHKLAIYSPDRAWLQEVLKSSLSKLELQHSNDDPVPSEALNPNLAEDLFEFDFSVSGKEEIGISKETQVLDQDPVEQTLDEQDSPLEKVETDSLDAETSNVPDPVIQVVDKETKDKPSTRDLDGGFSTESTLGIEAYSDYTTWLKSLKIKVDQKLTKEMDKSDKKLEPEAKIEIPEIPSTRSEGDVFGGIITETLADLLANQGQVDKAIGMYNRLSLIFPEKSSFFASKIAELKRNK